MKYLILIILLLPPSSTYAGLFDAISPSRMAIKDASEEMLQESNKLGEPFGLFGVNLLMIEDDFRKSCKNCSPHPAENHSYREYRNILGYKTAIIYKFDNMKSNKYYVLMQITLVPIAKYNSQEDIENIYMAFRDYVNKNIGPLPAIEDIYGSGNNRIGYKSIANYKYSSLAHSIEIYNNKIIHLIYLSKR